MVWIWIVMGWWGGRREGNGNGMALFACWMGGRTGILALAFACFFSISVIRALCLGRAAFS